jgi:hypothetical protein
MRPTLARVWNVNSTATESWHSGFDPVVACCLGRKTAAGGRLMDLDGFIKLGDSEIRAAHARADVASKMADVATKIAQLGLIREETIKKRLENIAKALDIKWDTQAHDHLLKIRNAALADAKRLEDEAQKAREFTDRMSRLLAGDGSWTAIRDAWLAFEYFRGRAPTTAAIKMGKVKVKPSAYKADSWRHPEDKSIADVPASERDLGRLWRWARTHTLYPKSDSAAWDALAEYFQIMSEAATARAAAIMTEADTAQNEAIELAKLDWERLKQPN